eukprot:TRINITY_DN2081_c0_g2_i1.p1 TRINITY_DN2081_c0_g2~~TRINITY_DN2081_c0_g2_i1.p1  ORF type:complete len:225 (+),score=57.18 TRINITY_DN2081_c0_g2_i1:163-837(+)
MWCCCQEEQEKSEIKITPIVQQPALTESAEASPVVEEQAVTEVTKNDPAPSGSFEFEVNLTVPHGVSLDCTDDVSAIVKDQIIASAADWNSKASNDKKIKVFDRVKKVNGQECKDSKECKALLDAASGNVTLTLQRPVERELVIKKPGTLGVSINYKQSSSAIWMAGISDGLVKTWNEAHPAQAVIAHDRIKSANGVTGETGKVLDVLRNAQGTIVLTVMSYKS